MGLQTKGELMEAIRVVIEGLPVSIVYREGKRQPLVIRGSESLRENPSRLAALRVALDHRGPTAAPCR